MDKTIAIVLAPEPTAFVCGLVMISLVLPYHLTQKPCESMSILGVSRKQTLVTFFCSLSCAKGLKLKQEMA